MYSKRVKIFIVLSSVLLVIFILRLMQMQLGNKLAIEGKIADLEQQRGLSRQLSTIRGRIIDRKGRIIAADQLCYQLNISYQLSCFADERVQRAKILQAQEKSQKVDAEAMIREEINNKTAVLREVMDKCALFGAQRGEIEDRLKNINDRVWSLRTFLAWARNNPSPAVLKKYDNQTELVPLPEATADFESRFPDADERLVLTIKVDDIAEIKKTWALLELKTEDDIFQAQLEFMDIDGIEVVPKSKRVYPFGSVACQTIGWVGPATRESDKQLFADDRLARYLSDEVCGREDGVEYVCEAVLRGRRGEAYYTPDGQRIEREQLQLGKDVRLTLDIELQRKIEQRFMDCGINSRCESGLAAVVIDVTTGGILSLVSTPTFDLNRVRFDYGQLASDANRPLLNRAINRQYPPGSVIKPLIFIAAAQSGKITGGEVISCPASAAPKGWPNCWIYRTSHSQGHDNLWSNNARNAIKGSCNVYFSHLADRIAPQILQQWLWNFGYGQKSSLTPDWAGTNDQRDFQQMSGQIWSGSSKDANQIPALNDDEKRWFGIGQGNLRATPLQVANAMAAIARGGVYKSPSLFTEEGNSSSTSLSLEISQQTLNVVRDGMRAVVEESGGTAYNEFVYAGFAAQGIKVYGKTGSTERPEHAWFGGFAVDGSGRSIAVAVLVEGGQHGSSDAAPLARDILRYCVEEGYVGRR